MSRRRHSGKQRLEFFKARRGVCHLCDGKIQIGEAWELEHVIPLALGGDDDEGNWMLAHVKCHKAKTKNDVALIAKAKRRERKYIGVKKDRTITRWRRFDGTIVEAPRQR